MKKLITALILVTLTACATEVLENQAYRSYVVGQARTVAIGEAFIVDQSGYRKKVKRWVGILMSPDGWEVKDEYSRDYIRSELLYSGKSANTIKVNYREFRGMMAAPSFFQAIEYDLNESKTIRFRKFAIQVLAASNQSIEFVILSDGRQ